MTLFLTFVAGVFVGAVTIGMLAAASRADREAEVFRQAYERGRQFQSFIGGGKL